MKRVLTGIKPTGTPHIGNYVGAIRPAIAASRAPGVESFYFLADYHALVGNTDPLRVQRSTLEIAATWLALGLDPDKVLFYRQSDIPEIPELTWLLTCVTGKGLLNRAHAYKAAVDANVAAGEDPDTAVTAGLYMYPVLMAADILMFNAHAVPVGRDQVQHIEIARDLAQRFNHLYGRDYFTLPEAQVEEATAVLPGLDGRKMSKSYDNVIPLWDEPKALRKKILGIVTNSQMPGEPKDPDSSHLFTIYQAFATPAETVAMRRMYAEGIAWGEAKEMLVDRLDRELAQPRKRYQELVSEPAKIEDIVLAGAARARARATPFLRELRDAVGLRSLAAVAQDAGHGSKSKKKGLGTAITFPEVGAWYVKIRDVRGQVLLSGGPFAGQAYALNAKVMAVKAWESPESFGTRAKDQGWVVYFPVAGNDELCSPIYASADEANAARQRLLEVCRDIDERDRSASGSGS
jgi:tryptophanyl-tRNA synthetase